LGVAKDLLRVLRVPLAPTAACDSAACLLLALGAGGITAWPGPVDWALLAATSLCVYGFGMGLNDWADRARDARLAPERPLPAGRLAPGLVLGVVVLLAVIALAVHGGRWGSWTVTGLALGLAALYDLATKHAFVPAALTMGLVRTANASLGVAPLVLQGHAPVWTLLAPLSIGLWSAGVSVLSSTEETPSVERVRAARALAALGILGAAGLGMLAARRVTLPGLLIAPSLLSLAAGRLPRPAPPKRQVLEMLLALYLLAAAVAAGAGLLEVDLGSALAAFLLIYLTQRLIFALRGAPPPVADPGPVH
jgi:4-hydroxybenzoate polyprenyltransferase